MAKARLIINMVYELEGEYKSKTPRGRFNSDRKAFENGDITLPEFVKRRDKETTSVKWRLFTDEQYEEYKDKLDAKSNKAGKPASKKKASDAPKVATKKKASAPVVATKKKFKFTLIKK